MRTPRNAFPPILPAVTVVSALACLARAENPPAPAPVALVERVVDGDTVVVNVDRQRIKVGLTGVDAPESVDPRKAVERFARQYADFLRGLVEGKRVRLAYEVPIHGPGVTSMQRGAEARAITGGRASP
jgi:endonuclease YncB( thermonuclease family)